MWNTRKGFVLFCCFLLASPLVPVNAQGLDLEEIIKQIGLSDLIAFVITSSPDILKLIVPLIETFAPLFGIITENPGIAILVRKLVERLPSLADNVLVNKILEGIFAELQSIPPPANETDPEKIVDHILSKVSILGIVGKTLQQIDLPDIFSKPGNVTDLCYNDMAFYLKRLTYLDEWALEMFDATGKPTTGTLRGNIQWLGDFDQCLGVKVHVPLNVTTKGVTSMINKVMQGQYCKMNLQIPVEIIGDEEVAPFAVVSLGLCVPRTCSVDDVNLMLNNISASLGAPPLETDCAPDRDILQDKNALVAIGILLAFVAMIGLGTLVDLLIIGPCRARENQQPSLNNTAATNHAFSSDGEKNGHVFTVSDAKGTEENYKQRGELSKLDMENQNDSTCYNGCIVKFFESFSLKHNFPKLVNTKTGQDSLRFIHGIRVLSMAWVILGHGYMLGFVIGNTLIFANPAVIPELIEKAYSPLILSGPFAVDTFFLLSGILVTYVFLNNVRRAGGKIGVGSIAWFYFHRFFRLTPLYMIILMIYVCLWNYLGEGPLWPLVNIESENCKHNWWTNLLYIQNLVNHRNMCMTWTWYLANDMQFYVVSPVILILWAKLPAVGYAAVAALFATCFVAQGVVSHNIISTAPNGRERIIEYFFEVYIRPWCRISTYLVGMLIGYLLHRTNSKINMKWYVALLGWLLSATACLTCVFVSYDETKPGGVEWSNAIHVFWGIAQRPLWGLGVGWVIVACATGYGGVINSILSWGFWVPLSRMTYAAYLVHPIVIYMIYYSSRQPLYITDPHMFYFFFGHLIFAYLIACVLCVVFETPFMGLEKIIRPKGPVSSQKVEQPSTTVPAESKSLPLSENRVTPKDEADERISNSAL